MAKPLDPERARIAWQCRLGDGITRALLTIAQGIYALCALAVAVDWGLESVLPVEDWAGQMDRRAVEDNSG